MDEIASAADVTRTTAQRWRDSEKVPSGAAREALRQRFGIDPADFDRPAEPIRRNSNRQRVRARTASERQRAGAHGEAERRIRAQLARLDEMRNEELSPAARLDLEALESRCNAQLSRITGEGLTIDEGKILRSIAWRRVESAMAKALEPWPEAMRAVALALAELGE